MKTCSRCGTAVSGAFCPNCGAWMNDDPKTDSEPERSASGAVAEESAVNAVSPRYCPNCGAEARGRFCAQCGAELTQDAQSGFGGANAASFDGNPYAVGAQTTYGGQTTWSGEPAYIPGAFEAFKVCWKKAFQFSGRASRSEFWYFAMWNALPAFLFYGVGVVAAFRGPDSPILYLILPLVLYLLVSTIPSISVAVRRLHDSNHSGWFWFLSLIPYVGSLIAIVFGCLPPTPGPNRYGPQPQKRN